jgi:hypothetical protein
LHGKTEVADEDVRTLIRQAMRNRDGWAFECGMFTFRLNIPPFKVTTNARDLMRHLSLSIDHPENAVPVHPTAEVEAVALQMQDCLFAKMPGTYWAWHSLGRMAP